MGKIVKDRIKDKAESVLKEGEGLARESLVKDLATKIVSIRLTDNEHRRIKSICAAAGVPLATGCARAVEYLIRLVDQGKVDISRTGIYEK
jgi:hypothetical protein